MHLEASEALDRKPGQDSGVWIFGALLQLFPVLGDRTPHGIEQLRVLGRCGDDADRDPLDVLADPQRGLDMGPRLDVPLACKLAREFSFSTRATSMMRSSMPCSRASLLGKL